MNENRLPDYLDHIQQAATDVCSFVEGLAKDDFLTDKRTQQAVILSLIIIGEAATKVMESYLLCAKTPTMKTAIALNEASYVDWLRSCFYAGSEPRITAGGPDQSRVPESL